MTFVPNKKPNILVIGDLMIDYYLWGSCERISPEAPVQIIDINKENTLLGGAGNVINNLFSLGARVEILSVIGDCQTSNDLLKLLSEINIDKKYLITEKGRITTKKTRVISSNQQVVRFDREITLEIDHESQVKILESYKKIISDFDIILLSDYGKGVLTFELTQQLIKIANENDKKILVDPKGSDYSKYHGAFLLTPNKKEASIATNISINDHASLRNAITSLKENFGLSLSLITLSEDGVAIFDNTLRIYPTAAREVFDVTGAGDTILASLGYALSCNYEIDEAIKFANLAAGVVVTKIGSATASIEEIREYEDRLSMPTSQRNVKTADDISSIVRLLKQNDKKIVFTNGCFDILHFGHIKYLEESKTLGDILIVGLNSDKSVTRLKGEKRPINSQNDRAFILASLEVVDYVVIFEEDTPLNLIKIIQPDILVKGNDYKDQKVVGENVAKEVKLLKFHHGKSTTELIDRIKSS